MSQGVKYDSEKLRWSLIPYESIKETIKVLMYGGDKYPEDDNWKRVPHARERYYNASLRHITIWFHGEKYDPETGFHHLAHAVCCLLFILWFELTETPDVQVPEGESDISKHDIALDGEIFKCYECKQDWLLRDKQEYMDQYYCPTCIQEIQNNE